MFISFRRVAVLLAALLCSLAAVDAVLAAPPAGDFTISDTTPQIGQSVTFTATGLTDPDGGTPTEITWNFGDGATATGTTASHSYANAGDKTVAMTIADPEGVAADSTTVMKTLHVNAQPTAAFTCAPATVAQNEATRCTSTSSDPEPGALSHAWDTDGDGFDDGTDPSEVFSYAQPGTKTIRLRVTDSDGAANTTERQVTVRPPQLNLRVSRPNANFAFAPQAPVPGEAIAFTSSSTPSDTPGNPQIVSTEWDFDYDPTKDFTPDASGATATTTFATPGPKTVAIKVTETGGGSAITSATVVVNAPPQASFNVAPGSVLAGDTVTLFSTSGDPDGPIAAQQWDLDGDGQYDDASGAVATRRLPKGSHRVALRVVDSRGAVATAERRVTVGARPLKLLEGVKITLFGILTREGARFERLFVRTPARATVKITCKGKSCPKSTTRKRAAKTQRLRFKKFERLFPAGTLITVSVTRSGYIGQQTTIKVRGGLRRYIRRDRCIHPASGKPIACPAS
jgi:PKD repeat protein